MDLRCKDIDICMADAMPFQQHWECRTTWPLSDVLNNQFFLAQRGMLRSGDVINVCRYDRSDPTHRGVKMIEAATVRVISAGNDAKAVELALLGPILTLGEEQARPGEYAILRGQSGKHKIVKGDELVQEFGSKAEAEAGLKILLAA